MREFGINTIHRTGDLQIDVLTVEVKRAQNAAFEATSKADVHAGVDAELKSNGTDSECLAQWLPHCSC